MQLKNFNKDRTNKLIIAINLIRIIMKQWIQIQITNSNGGKNNDNRNQ